MSSPQTPICFDFDIVERIPKQICAHVFSFLSTEELLSASLVSKDWYNTIGRTPECMKKPTVVFHKFKFQQNSLRSSVSLTKAAKEMLTRSSRNYENIKLVGSDLTSSELKNILKIRSRKWKKVNLAFIRFETASKFLTVLSCIDKTVVELEIEHVRSVDQTQIESCALTFPKLKVLTLIGASSEQFNAFANVTTLMEYYVMHSDHYSDASDYSKSHEMLKRNENLQKLRIYGRSFDIDISEGLQCKLTSLILIMGLSPDNEGQKMNQLKLLQSQHMTLKSVIVYGWTGVEATQVFFRMPNLESLKLLTFGFFGETIDWETIKLHRNTAITTFILDWSCKQVDILRVFFTAMPNLKHLHLGQINDEILDLVATNYPNLETLVISTWDVTTDVSDKDILKSLKELSAENVRERSLRSMQTGHFAEMVNEMVKETVKKMTLY